MLSPKRLLLVYSFLLGLALAAPTSQSSSHSPGNDVTLAQPRPPQITQPPSILPFPLDAFNPLFAVARARAPLDHGGSLLPRAEFTNETIPAECRTTCSGALVIYQACSSGNTGGCLAVCSQSVFDNFIGCFQCIVDGKPEATAAQIADVQSSVDSLKTACAASGLPVTGGALSLSGTAVTASASATASSLGTLTDSLHSATSSAGRSAVGSGQSSAVARASGTSYATSTRRTSASGGAASSSNDDSSSDLSTAAKIGIGVGLGFGGLVLVLLALFYIFRRREKRRHHPAAARVDLGGGEADAEPKVEQYLPPPPAPIGRAAVEAYPAYTRLQPAGRPKAGESGTASAHVLMGESSLGMAQRGDPEIFRHHDGGSAMGSASGSGTEGRERIELPPSYDEVPRR